MSLILEIVLSNRFRKDLKLLAKRSYNLELLNGVVTKLAAKQPLPDKNHDHAPSGDCVGFRECHISPDWLLIYRVEEDALLLFSSRIETHSDLF